MSAGSPFSTLAPLFAQLKCLLDKRVIQAHDFTGAVILAYLAHQRPKNWTNGKMKPRVVDGVGAAQLRERSCTLSTVPELAELLSPAYVCKKLGISTDDFDEIRVCTIFNELKFSNIKQNSDNYINHSIVKWAMALYPFQLLFHIPTPMDVLRMQAVGERVVTVFVAAEELDAKHVAQLHYMDGNELTVRDSFEFLAHDLKHMEHFADPDKYLEQVGFFHGFLYIPRVYNATTGGAEGAATLSLKKVFTEAVCPGDIRLWHQLEYVISDMNCYLPHLLKYVLAKLLEAAKRGNYESGCADGAGLESFHHLWGLVLDCLVPDCAKDKPHLYTVLRGMSTRILHPVGVTESVLGAATATAAVGASYTDCANLFSAEDGELVREYFRVMGAAARRSHFEASASPAPAFGSV